MLGGAVHPAALHPRTPVPVTDPAPLAVVLLSGGLDSMVSAALARERGFRLLALTIDYNQRHRIEIGAATRIAAELGAERHIVLPLDLTGFGGSALTANPDVPKGGVEERSAEHTSELPSLM